MIYTITPLTSSYLADTGDCAPDLDMVWRSEMCWFSPGREVLIRDENGNMKIYKKGDPNFE